MWDDIWTLVVGTVFIPIIVVFGLFRLAALKRAKDLPPHQVSEWAASRELREQGCREQRATLLGLF
jgi:hypothetical protein